jgi:perosamine synthetase
LDKIITYYKDYYQTNENIYLHVPCFYGNENKYLNECIENNQVSSIGRFIPKFESEFSSFLNTKYSVATVNGTAALQVALRIVGVEKDDEVITQALTFVATANAIKYLGAEPVFIDVDRDTMGLSPKFLSDFLEKNAKLVNGICINKLTGKKISACVPMHTFGFPIDIVELQKVCNQWNIPIVEDAAEAIGSKYCDKYIGSFGKVSAFSFNGNKIVTAGGGGAITTNDEQLAHKVLHLISTAKVPHQYEYFHDEMGYNYKMPNLNAALLCAQMENINTFLKIKRKMAFEFSHVIEKEGFKFRNEMPNTTANYWIMCVELKNKKERNFFLEKTNANGVMTRPIWQLIYKLPMYQNCYRDNQINAQFLEERIVNIPSSVKNDK